jgi:hypothetical protein
MAATVVIRLIICATPVCVVLLRCTPQLPVEKAYLKCDVIFF